MLIKNLSNEFFVKLVYLPMTRQEKLTINTQQATTRGTAYKNSNHKEAVRNGKGGIV